MTNRQVETQERRSRERTAFFLIPGTQGTERFWVFKPAEEPDALAAVVLDAGGGGFRLLVEPPGPIAAGEYVLRLLPDDKAAAASQPLRCRVRLAWYETEGSTACKAGVHVVEDAAGVEARIRDRGASGDKPALVRCTLRPIQA